MLPQEHVRWLSRQPETILSPDVVRRDRQGIAFFPLSTDSRTILLAAHKIIAEALNQKLDALQPQIFDGIRHAVDAGLGTDEEWRELPLMDTLSAVLDSSVSRVMFGPKLSRDTGFLRLLRLFIIGGGVLTELVGQLPVGLFRPVVGVPFNLFTTAVKKICVAYYLRPEISKRLRQMDSGDEKDDEDDEAFDFMTQCVRAVRNLKFPIKTDEIIFISDMLMFLVSQHRKARSDHLHIN
jgi:hypothetical protein